MNTATISESEKFQFEYDESLAYYEHTLNVVFQQPFEFDFYLHICKIINEIVNIYTEEKNCDYSSAIISMSSSILFDTLLKVFLNFFRKKI
jgi:hypothetical protein